MTVKKRDLGNLHPASGSTANRKRVGRGIGSGTGKTSARGHKGTGARAGGHVAPGFEGGQMPLIRRLPKRGFRNPSRLTYQIVSIGQLERLESGTVVDAELLRRERVVRRRGPIKILSDGELTKPLTVRVDAVSGKAREKIEAAGGTIEVLTQ